MYQIYKILLIHRKKLEDCIEISLRIKLERDKKKSITPITIIIKNKFPSHSPKLIYQASAAPLAPYPPPLTGPRLTAAVRVSFFGAILLAVPSFGFS